MRNPFSAIGSALSRAGQAVTSAVGKVIGGTGKALSKAGQGLAKTGEKLSTPKAPKTKAPKTPPVAPPKKTPEPTKLPPAPPPEGKRPPKLPPTDFGPGGPGGNAGGISNGISRDERVLGVDSDAERDLREAIKDFEADHRINLLGDRARGFIDHPSFSTIFDKYSTGSGWSSDQWFNGANNIRDIQITKQPGGKIKITFDADFVIDGDSNATGDIGTRTVTAIF